MKCRSHLRADQLFTAGSLEGQVENSWFLPIEPSHEAYHVLRLSIDVSETRMNCNLQGVKVNGRSIDGEDPGTDGTDPIDIMWRFFQWSVGN